MKPLSYDLENLGRVKLALNALPPKRKKAQGYYLVEALYVEIREARKKGVTWDAICETLRSKGIDISSGMVRYNFQAIDAKMERETDEPALPVKAYNKRLKNKEAASEEAAE